jgi:hypothetical protein
VAIKKRNLTIELQGSVQLYDDGSVVITPSKPNQYLWIKFIAHSVRYMPVPAAIPVVILDPEGKEIGTTTAIGTYRP